MFKDSKVMFTGTSSAYFTNGKVYPVLAGKGDGVPRNDGKTGAFIKNDTAFVIENDRGYVQMCSTQSGNWSVVEEAAGVYQASAKMNPINKHIAVPELY